MTFSRCIIFTLAWVCAAGAAETDRAAWFQDAKFGLFIHWGAYAVPAGVYQGRDVERSPGRPALGEWIMHDAKIPVAEYAQYAREFNPVKFDADAWVKIAQAAGMKYIVITAKHHDGFAMFKSEVSGFNISDAAPFSRDPLKELAAACQRAGLRLGFYYSQAQDWSHPGGAAWGNSGPMTGGDPAAGYWDAAQAGDFDTYLDRVAIPQVRELLSNYGPVAILWWDTPIGMTAARAARFAPLLKLQPQMLTNNRLLDPDHPNPYSGDTETPEQSIPATGLKDRRFEVCMTLNDTWGYKVHDQNWKSAADITRKLIDIASKGGNFLLNVGPTEEGDFPAASVERLRACGIWVHANQEALYGTRASLFRRLAWGRSTTKGRAVYLEVFDWPADRRLIVPGLKSQPEAASLLVGGTALPFSKEGNNLIVTVPRSAPDPVASVIKLEFAEPPAVDQPLPPQESDGRILFRAPLAVIVNSYSGNARVEGNGETAQIAHWNQPGITAAWDFDCTQPGTFFVEIEVIAPGDPVFSYGAGTALQRGASVQIEGSDFRWVRLGRLSLAKRGEQTLTLKSTGGNWNGVRLRSVRLVPVEPDSP